MKKILLIASALTSLMGTPTLAQDGAGIHQQNVQCQTNPSLAWCGTTYESNSNRDSSIIYGAIYDAHKYFTYDDSDENVQTWNVDLKNIKRNASWSGNCVSYAEAVVELAAERGYDTHNLYFALVSTDNTVQIDHLIALIKLPDGNMKIIADTSENPKMYNYVYIMKVSDGPHHWNFVHNMDTNKIFN